MEEMGITRRVEMKDYRKNYLAGLINSRAFYKTDFKVSKLFLSVIIK